LTEGRGDGEGSHSSDDVGNAGNACADSTSARQDSLDGLDGKYEYLDHTADVQLHSWGSSLEEALENLVAAMFGYMTDLGRIHPRQERTVAVSAHDAPSLVLAFLQEWLTRFHEDGFVARRVRVAGAVDRGLLPPRCWTVAAQGDGEVFDPSRHVPGTEVKAVTYSNLQVVEGSSADEEEGRCDIWVIVDI
jgi:SHS2 domain-containing protein